ncbi:MAG: hypothetical protein NXI22_16625 [bacterium]|nr:hypothetical protein [bacterium]
MAIELTPEMVAGLHASENQQLEVVDPQTKKVFVISDLATHRLAKIALELDAIRAKLRELSNQHRQPVDDNLLRELNLPNLP